MTPSGHFQPDPFRDISARHFRTQYCVAEPFIVQRRANTKLQGCSHIALQPLRSSSSRLPAWASQHLLQLESRLSGARENGFIMTDPIHFLEDMPSD